MKTATLIHNGWLSAKNGANTVMNSLLDSKPVFRENGIELNRCTLDDIIPRSFEAGSHDVTKSKFAFRGKMRVLFTSLSKYNVLFTWLFFHLTKFKTAKRIVNHYLNTVHSKEDVAFFHTVIPCYYFLKMRKHRQPTVLVLHTNGEPCKMECIYYPKLYGSFLYEKLIAMYNFSIENVDRINFVAAEPMRNFLQLNPQIDPTKVSFIYNGVPDGPCKRSDKLGTPIEICCVGSISDRKGQPFIVEALSRLSDDERTRVHFTLLGDGDKRLELERICSERNLNGSITFAGVKSNVDEYLLKSDIFILPSTDEGLPMAIIEGMRAGLPIISTPVGGIPEMLKDGYNGVMMLPSAEALYDILKHIDHYDWLSMGKNARSLFEEKFSGQKMAESYAELLSLG